MAKTTLKESRPIRALFLESGTGPGGSVNFLREFLPYLDPEKIDPLVGFYFPNSSRAVDDMRSRGVPVTFFQNSPRRGAERRPSALELRLKPLRVARSSARVAWRMLTKEAPQVWPLVRFLKHNRIELVVLNQDVHFHLPGVLAAKLCGLPCVCRKAGGIGEAQRIKRIVTPWVDLFVSISEATHKDQLETPGTRQLIMLHEGLDLKQFQRVPSKEVARRALGIPGGKTVVATISRIEKGKGQIEFLRMAAEVVRSERNVCFLVVGDEGADGGTLMAELAALASSLHLDDAVVFAGWRNDVPAVMAAVDIFVHCPTTFIEGLARTCLEAMAMKLPSIVSDNGGMSDAVIDGVTGFLIAPGDIGAMASAVLRLIRDDNLRRIQGIEARRRIEQMFNMPENAKRLQDVLVECAGQRRGAARSLEVTAVADAV